MLSTPTSVNCHSDQHRLTTGFFRCLWLQEMNRACCQVVIVGLPSLRCFLLVGNSDLFRDKFVNVIESKTPRNPTSIEHSPPPRVPGPNGRPGPLPRPKLKCAVVCCFFVVVVWQWCIGLSKLNQRSFVTFGQGLLGRSSPMAWVNLIKRKIRLCYSFIQQCCTTSILFHYSSCNYSEIRETNNSAVLAIV